MLRNARRRRKRLPAWAWRLTRPLRRSSSRTVKGRSSTSTRPSNAHGVFEGGGHREEPRRPAQRKTRRVVLSGDVGYPRAGRYLDRAFHQPEEGSGHCYEEDATISPLRDSSGKIVNFVAAKRDVTEMLSLEKQVRTAQKMEAVGTLAGGHRARLQQRTDGNRRIRGTPAHEDGRRRAGVA